MTERQAHRQLLSAAKLLVHRVEQLQERGIRLWQPDWRAIEPIYRAIHDSTDALDSRLHNAKPEGTVKAA
jgi:hypothetical protein